MSDSRKVGVLVLEAVLRGPEADPKALLVVPDLEVLPIRTAHMVLVLEGKSNNTVFKTTFI